MRNILSTYPRAAMSDFLNGLLSPDASEVLPLTFGVAPRLPAEDLTPQRVGVSLHHNTTEYSLFRPAKPISRFVSKAAQARLGVRAVR